MAASGQTPRDFGHRVRSHPMMMVTSQVKMRSGKQIDITFAGDMSETINFWRGPGAPRSQLASGSAPDRKDRAQKGSVRRCKGLRSQDLGGVSRPPT